MIAIALFGPPQPVPGFRYPAEAGVFAEYRWVMERSGAGKQEGTYRVQIVAVERRGRRQYLRIRHTVRGAETRVVEFLVEKNLWQRFLARPASTELRVERVWVGKEVEKLEELKDPVARDAMQGRLGPGFFFLERFGEAVGRKPKPQKESWKNPQTGVEEDAWKYTLDYTVDEYYPEELPKRTISAIRGWLLASDRVPFGIVQAELTKEVSLQYEVPGVRAPPTRFQVRVRLVLQRWGSEPSGPPRARETEKRRDRRVPTE